MPSVEQHTPVQSPAPSVPNRPPLMLDTSGRYKSQFPMSPSRPRAGSVGEALGKTPLSLYTHLKWDSPTSPPRYNYFPMSPPTSRSNSQSESESKAPIAPELRRPMSFGSYGHDRCSGPGCGCARHHHRNGSVAIKFGPTYLEDPFYDDDDPMSPPVAMRRHSASTLQRPPSPIAEHILKGDFSF